jgi:hypothetical protein
MDSEIGKLTKAMQRANSYNEMPQLMIRSFIAGIIQALGATIGFALVLVILAALVNVGGGIPIVSNILKETNLDVIIQNQLQKIQQEQTITSTPIPSNTPALTISPTVTPSVTPTK